MFCCFLFVLLFVSLSVYMRIWKSLFFSYLFLKVFFYGIVSLFVCWTSDGKSSLFVMLCSLMGCTLFCTVFLLGGRGQ